MSQEFGGQQDSGFAHLRREEASSHEGEDESPSPPGAGAVDGPASTPATGVQVDERDLHARGRSEGASFAGDPTLDALDALVQALQGLARDRQLLEEKLHRLRRRREAGAHWREILADEDPPASLQVVSRMLASLAAASGTLRKELVGTLRREGVSIPAIARMFGVTHQRVSNLLRRPPG